MKAEVGVKLAVCIVLYKLADRLASLIVILFSIASKSCSKVLWSLPWARTKFSLIDSGILFNMIGTSKIMMIHMMDPCFLNL